MNFSDAFKQTLQLCRFSPDGAYLVLMLIFVALILMLNGSNDVFLPKDGPLGGQDDGRRHMGKIFPKNSPKRGTNRQFQAKTPKSLHRNISGTINPTK